MNEQVARAVVLVRAIETADVKREVLSADDRKYASRSARTGAVAGVRKRHRRHVRALPRTALGTNSQTARRTDAQALGGFLARRSAMVALSLALPPVAFLLGAGLDRIGDPHRVDLLSAPLLGIIGWNLAIYLFLVVWRLMPSLRRGAPDRFHSGAGGQAAVQITGQAAACAGGGPG
ncbi:hypothetical protein LP420_14605 [Massilia sp. B-10]|nr:hypothetical protein LP420_14605 [Massilia sp. B-10]